MSAAAVVDVSSSSEVEVDSEWERTLTDALRSPKRSEAIVRLFPCSSEGCGKVFSTWEESKEHDERFHQDDQVGQSLLSLECEHRGCGRKFTKRSYLKVHMASHSSKRKFVCPEGDCGASYKTGQALRRHRRDAHGREEVADLACPSCPATFASVASLSKHGRRVHDNESRFPCDRCGRTFHKRSHLTAHLARDHDGTLPHKCPHCEKRFVTPNKVRVHVEARHVPKRCGEPGCGRTEFRTHAELRRHVAEEHTARRKCPRCRKTFVRKERYEAHVLSHPEEEKEKVFQCSHEGCDRTYLHYRNLKNHERVIHQMLRHECREEGCGKKYASRKKLRQHQQQAHGGEGGKRRRRRKPPKTGEDRKPRKDAGTVRKSMASLLTSTAEEEGKKGLAGAEGVPLDIESVREDIGRRGDLQRGFRREKEEEREDETGAEVCRRENSTRKTGSWKDRLREEVFRDGGEEEEENFADESDFSEVEGQSASV